MTKELIINIMLDSGIDNYTINDDLSIDINENVDLNNEEPITKYMKDGTINLNIINGNFSCMLDGDLKNASMPRIVNGDFDISFSNFETLERCPGQVKGDYNCSFNNLTTLKGCVKEINGDFYCTMNSLTSLEYGPNIVSGNVDLTHNELTTLKHAPFGKSYDLFGNNFKENITDDNIQEIIRNYKIIDILE